MKKIEEFLFRCIPVWAFGVTVLVFLMFSMFTSWAVLHTSQGGNRLGKSGELLLTVAGIPQTIKKLFSDYDELACSEQRFDNFSGFTFNYSPNKRPEAPYILLNRYDGNIGQSVSELYDLNSHQKIHTWIIDVGLVWNEINFDSRYVDLKRDKSTKRFQNAHTLVLDDGSIIFQASPSPLLKFNISGKQVWVNDNRCFHHSIELDHEGNIWVPSHIEPSTVNIGANPNEPFIDDAITKISPNGKILYSKSVTHMFDENGLGHLIYARGTTYNDPIHLNDIEPVFEDGDFFKKGDVFLSLRHQSMVLLYRPSTNKILWYSLGPWRHQHDVDVINNHEIAVFDNNANTAIGEWHVDGVNKFITYDFRTEKYNNHYNKGFQKHDIRTITDGRSQLLSDQKLLVEESNYGRLIAFDKMGNIDWQFINRANNGKIYLLNWSRLVPRSVGDKVRKIVKK